MSEENDTYPGQNVGESQAALFTKSTNPWEEYFGPRNLGLDLNPYDKQRLDCLDLPAAYIGKNYYLAEMVNGLILRDFDWYTTVALPTLYTDKIDIKWNEVTFNKSLVDEVPERGVARLVTSSSRQFTDRQVRRGIMMMLEHGFMRTPEGQEHYRRQLVNIANSVKITNAYDVLHALLNAHRYDIQWEINHGVQHDSREYLRIKKHEWAVLQKSEHGFDIMIESAKKRMKTINGVSPNVLILPPKAAMYINMKAAVDRSYKIIGPAGQEMMQQGAALTTFRGLDVYETQAFDLFDDSLPVQLLTSDRMCGSYFVHDFRNGPVKIYDEDHDRFETITLAQAIREGGVPDDSDEGEGLRAADESSEIHGPSREHDKGSRSGSQPHASSHRRWPQLQSFQGGTAHGNCFGIHNYVRGLGAGFDRRSRNIRRRKKK